jgi:3-oxoacyl-[acyl-carrier protein] reductase
VNPEDTVVVDLALKNRRALVTAASKGLGRACAEALAAEGARVFVSSRDAEAIAAAGASIGAVGWSAADVAKEGDVGSLVKAAIEKLGGLDILVVNAGGPPPGTLESLPLESWQKAFDLTLMSAVRLVHASIPHLKRSDQGRIVFITSISVRQPIRNLILSNSLRAAVTGMAKSLSFELALERVTVNCLAPDAIRTDALRRLAGGTDAEQYLAQMADHAPMKRLGEPAEVGAACAFLCSRQAGYITGQALGVDGGSQVGVH